MIGSVDQFVHPGREILGTEHYGGTHCSRAEVSQGLVGRVRIRSHVDAPRLSDISQGQVQNPLVVCSVDAERFAIRILNAEDRYGAKAVDDVMFCLILIVGLFGHLLHTRGENPEGLSSPFYKTLCLPPLLVATGVVSARYCTEQLVVPAPAAARHVIFAMNEDRSQRFGKAFRVSKRADDPSCDLVCVFAL